MAQSVYAIKIQQAFRHWHFRRVIAATKILRVARAFLFRHMLKAVQEFQRMQAMFAPKKTNAEKAKFAAEVKAVRRHFSNLDEAYAAGLSYRSALKYSRDRGMVGRRKRPGMRRRRSSRRRRRRRRRRRGKKELEARVAAEREELEARRVERERVEKETAEREAREAEEARVRDEREAKEQVLRPRQQLEEEAGREEAAKRRRRRRRRRRRPLGGGGGEGEAEREQAEGTGCGGSGAREQAAAEAAAREAEADRRAVAAEITSRCGTALSRPSTKRGAGCGAAAKRCRAKDLHDHEEV